MIIDCAQVAHRSGGLRSDKVEVSVVKIEEGKNVSIEGPYSENDLKSLGRYSEIEKLSLTKLKNLTVKIAEGLCSLKSVKELFLWSSVNRTAMRHVITIPDLEILDILEIRNPGKLMKFSEAVELQKFRCNHYMSEADLLEISNLPKIREIGAQNSEITRRALEELLCLPYLTNLDLEATKFTDKLAAIIAASQTIKHLSVGASKLTAKGLRSISTMSQLESLDIWAIDISEADLAPLSKLQNLKYLSVGGYEGQTRLTFKGVMPHIDELPSLRSLWLDGIILSDSEKLNMNNKYEYFRS